MKTAVEQFTLALIKAKAIKPSATKDFVKANTDALEVEKEQMRHIYDNQNQYNDPLNQSFDEYYQVIFNDKQCK